MKRKTNMLRLTYLYKSAIEQVQDMAEFSPLPYNYAKLDLNTGQQLVNFYCQYSSIRYKKNLKSFTSL